MDKSIKAWQGVLEEFDGETAFWAKFQLHSVKQAMHFSPWEGEKAGAKLITSGALASAKKYYPYVEGLEGSIKEALRWMKRPPARLREGLVLLSEGKQPNDLFLIFKLYGDFREHLAVIYARDPDYAGFANQRKGSQAPQKQSGRANQQKSALKISHKLKRFAASFMMAVIRKRGVSTKNGIKEARHWLEEFAADVVLKKRVPPEEFAACDFSALLQKAPTKINVSDRRLLSLHEKFRKELTAPHLEEWVDEILVLKIQELKLI